MAEQSQYWNDAYNNAYNNTLRAAYDNQAGTIKAALGDERTALQNQFNSANQTLGDTRDQSLRNAYISYETAKRSLPETMRLQGINGGMTESTASELSRAYARGQSTANTQYSKDYGSLNDSYNNNLLGINARQTEALGNLDVNRRNEAYTIANALEQTRQQEEARRLQQQYQEQQAALERERLAQEKALADQQLALQMQQLQMQQAAASQAAAYSGGSSSSGGSYNAPVAATATRIPQQEVYAAFSTPARKTGAYIPPESQALPSRLDKYRK
jgi:hypothetical protein